MASSMLSGDRRWAPARKSGMTVLGKVPKPINLPSQRLENHGLDPNVEIVPKGTLTWGSRPSSAAPNAWASSTSTVSSPNTDGSAASPTRLLGRPSSGESGTRPSTAGSDRSHDPPANTWGPNSRPSSASGILVSNQSSLVATRPRSAETRPGSSQLSRFAESAAENLVAWGATGTVERLGHTSSKTNGFNLSSGDFPTLGSEKNSESHMQHGHNQGRPASASGSVASQKERLEIPTPGDEAVDSCLGEGNVNSWSRDLSPHTTGGVTPNVGNWHMDPQQAHTFHNVNLRPHQFGPWRGPPIQNSPDGVWYRGGHSGGPYRPAPPVTYPVEPFAYYPAQLPARPLPNSQSGPRPGAILGGYPPKNGDPYHPHMPPDSYMVPGHPVMPVRPGAYPGPVPYDGYYGPPRATFCNPNERENITGMATQAGAHNQHPIHMDSGNFFARPSRSAPTMVNEQMETVHVHGAHEGQYKVLLKQHDGWEDNDPEEKKGPSATVSMPHLVNAHRLGASTREDELGANCQKGGPKPLVKLEAARSSSQPASGVPAHSSVSIVANMPEVTGKAEAVDNQVKKLETSVVPAADTKHHSSRKNVTLIEKIESLNNKTRTADGHYEVPVSAREEKLKQSKTVNTKVDHSTKVVHTPTIISVEAPCEKSLSIGTVAPASIVDQSTGDNYLESSGADKVVSRTSQLQGSAADISDSSEVGPNAHSQINKRAHGTQGRADYRGRLKFNAQDGEEWRKKSPGTGRDSSTVATVANADEVHTQDCHASPEASEKQELHHVIKVGDEPYMTSSLDSIDYRAQRAKMKEIATQRAKQLQKEEEERIREQKAKALAKLEELNRRTLVENSNKVLDHTEPFSTSAAQHEQEVKAPPAQKTHITGEDLGRTSSSNSDAALQESSSKANKLEELTVVQTSDSGTDKLGESFNSSMCATLESSQSASQPVISNNPSLSLGQNVPKAEVDTHSTNLQFYDNSAPKQKPMGHRRRQNILQDKNPDEKIVADGNTGGPKSVDGVSAPSYNDLPNSSNDPDDPSVQPKKRNNRSVRNRNKLDEAYVASATLPSSADNEGNFEKPRTESDKTKCSGSVIGAISVPPQTSKETVGIQNSRDAVITSPNQGLPQSTEEAQGKSTNQWKPQQPRRTMRNIQAGRASDKLNGTEAAIWAPVKSLNKNELSEKAQSTFSEANNQSSGKDVNDGQNSSKLRRAEMERYVPKPAAKELSQQENTQQSSPSNCQTASSEITAKSEMGSRGTTERVKLGGSSGVKGVVTVDPKTGDNSKPGKHGRTHASWRQRGSIESSPALVSSHEKTSSDAQTFQKPSDQQQSAKFDCSLKEQPEYSDDGWNDDTSDLTPGEPVTIPAVVKDYGVTGKGRRQPHKGPRSAANNFVPGEDKEVQVHRRKSDKTDTQSAVFESNESDEKHASKPDNHNVGENMRSQWQPKSQPYSTHNSRQGSRGSGGQRVPSQSGKFGKESPLRDTAHPPQSFRDSSMTQRPGSAEIRNTHHQGANRENNVTMDQPHFHDQEFSTADELARGNVDHVDRQYRQPVPSGLHRQGNHNGWFARGQETLYGRGRGPEQESRKQSLPFNGDRRKHNNSHYEYQRIGSYNNPKDTFQANPVVGDEGHDSSSRAAGSRYKERVQNHQSRRGGHFHGQNSGAM